MLKRGELKYSDPLNKKSHRSFTVDCNLFHAQEKINLCDYRLIATTSSMSSLILQRLHIYFKQNNRLGIAISFSASIILSLLLLAGRIIYSGNSTYIFLTWNLFLALIPLAISTVLTVYGHGIRNYKFWKLGFVFLIWLLFFPNAPYIITDLFHLHKGSTVPQWYDLVLILSFAWNGLMLACASLFDMQELFIQRFNRFAGWVFVGTTLFISSFGIYLGRFQRFNSWDILQRPFRLMGDSINFIFHPLSNPGVWGMTICYTLFMCVLYATVYQLTRVQSKRFRAEVVAELRKGK